MKILTSKKQEELTKLFAQCQVAINRDDFVNATDRLSEIAVRCLDVNRCAKIIELTQRLNNRIERMKDER